MVDELGGPEEVEGVVDITNDEALSLLQTDPVASQVARPIQLATQADLEMHGVLPQSAEPSILLTNGNLLYR